MTLPATGFIQQVEIVVGGILPRAGFVQPVEIIGGGGGFITGSGTPNQVAKFTGASSIGDSSISDTGSLVTVANPLLITSGSSDQYIESTDGASAAVSGAATGRLRYNNSTGKWQVSSQGGAYTDIATGSTGVTLDGAYDFGGPGAGRVIAVDAGPVQFSESASTTQSFVVDGTSGGIASAAGATWGDITFNQSTQVSGSTNITTAAGFNKVVIGQPTISASPGPVVITNAGNLVITGAPVAGSGVTITNSYSLWVDSGTSRFDGAVHLSLSGAVLQSDTTTGLTFSGSGGANLYAGASGNGIAVFGSGSSANRIEFTIDATSAPGNVAPFYFFAQARSGLAAGTEQNRLLSQGGTTDTYATGAITNLRTYVFEAISYAFVGASTVTNAATLYVNAAPTAGANATLTNSYAFWVDAGLSRIDGSLQLAGADTQYIESLDGQNAALSGAATGRIRYNNGTATWQVSVQGGAYVSIATGAVGVTLDGAYDFGGAGAGRTITVDSGAVTLTAASTTVGTFTINGSHTIASASNAVWNDALFDSDVSISGSTNISTATGFNMVQMNAPTITDVGTVTIIDQAATLYIGGPPVGSGVIITSAYALWVDAGDVRLDGSTLSLGGVCTITVAGANTLINSTGGTLSIIGTAGQRGFTFVTVANSSGATAGFAFTGAANTAQTAGTEALDVNFNMTATLQHASNTLVATQRSVLIQPRTYSFATSGGTITNAASLAISAAPIAGTNATITNNYALWVQADRALFDGGALVGAEPTGVAGKVAYTNTVNNAANDVGVGVILMKGATGRNSSGFLKILDGTTARFIPYFDAITG